MRCASGDRRADLLSLIAHGLGCAAGSLDGREHAGLDVSLSLQDNRLRLRGGVNDGSGGGVCGGYSEIAGLKEKPMIGLFEADESWVH